MNLDFLAEEMPERITEPATHIPAPVPGMLWLDKSETSRLELQFSCPLDSPYMQRSIKNCEKYKIKVVPTLKEAIASRSLIFGDMIKAKEARIEMRKPEYCVTYHEADILNRQRVDLTNEFFWNSLILTVSIITEEDARFCEGVYILRYRYNKGREWARTKRQLCTREVAEKGNVRLIEIKGRLERLGFPLHYEELENGVHEQFLKPEYLTFQKFSDKLNHLSSRRTIQEREEYGDIIKFLSGKGD